MERKLRYALMVGVGCFMLISCGSNTQQLTEATVKKYLDTTLNDPSSYQSISFSQIKRDTFGFFEIQHTYRAKNAFGALIKTTQWFNVDTTFRWCGINNYHIDNPIYPDSAKAADSARRADSIVLTRQTK